TVDKMTIQFLLAIGLALATAQDCPESFTQFGSYCFHQDLNSYHAHGSAVEFCASMSSTLPYPTGDLGEWQTAVAEALNSVDCGGRGRFGGATLENDGKWYWPDGSPVQEDAWISGDYSDGDSCSLIYCSGLMYDISCSYNREVLCQAPLMTTTTTELTTTTSSVPLEGLTCYSCLDCPAVDETTTTISSDDYKACATAYSSESGMFLRFAVTQLHKDGECVDDGTLLKCFCTTNLCNNV
ncbi:unnamed protein product, partial [Meganyctiphanes norvegica]